MPATSWANLMNHLDDAPSAIRGSSEAGGKGELPLGRIPISLLCREIAERMVCRGYAILSILSSEGLLGDI